MPWEGGLSSDVQSSSSMTSVPKTKGRLCASNWQCQILSPSVPPSLNTPCIPLPFIQTHNPVQPTALQLCPGHSVSRPVSGSLQPAPGAAFQAHQKQQCYPSGWVTARTNILRSAESARPGLGQGSQTEWSREALLKGLCVQSDFFLQFEFLSF